MSNIAQLGAGPNRPLPGEGTALHARAAKEAVPQEQREEVEPSTRQNRPEPTRALLEKMSDDMNRTLASVTSLKFSVDRESRKLVVRVVDQSSDKVIRQIPNEDMVELSKKMKDLQGVLLNATA